MQTVCFFSVVGEGEASGGAAESGFGARRRLAGREARGFGALGMLYNMSERAICEIF